MRSKPQKVTIAILVVIGLWAGLTSVAQAQMGKTAAQCSARFGKAKTVGAVKAIPGKQIALYRKGGYEIIVSFWKGRANRVLYQKTNKTDFSTHELQRLLDENRGPSSWSAFPPLVEPDEDGNPIRVWQRADGIGASYHFDEDEKARVMGFWIIAEETKQESAN